LGTAADNNADKIAKGREGHGTARGSASARAKLTEEKVQEIRRRYIPGRKNGNRSLLAREYGVHGSTINDVVKRRWRHVV
jgi:DNA invertase Pin-like site-specific DNA recombinase